MTHSRRRAALSARIRAADLDAGVARGVHDLYVHFQDKIVVFPIGYEKGVAGTRGGRADDSAVLYVVFGGAGEFLEQGRNCLLVTPGDVGGIRDAIAGLEGDPDYRLQLGLAGRVTISRFNIDTYISTLSALYEELAGNQHAKQNEHPGDQDGLSLLRRDAPDLQSLAGR